jgi:acetyl esterase
MPVDPILYPGFDPALLPAEPDYRGEPPEVIAERMRAAGLAVPCQPGSVEVTDISFTGPTREIPVRIYQPQGEGPFPVLVSFHGGGWVMGSLEIDGARNVQLAERAGCVIVSVDYCLAPEHRFPDPVEEAYAALVWAVGHATQFGGDARRVAVCGGSAGGNLAAATALMARDRGGPKIAFQLLYYPVCVPDFESLSYIENGKGFGLTADAMRWFWDQYAPSVEDRRHPYAAPLLADSLHDLPPALVVAAEFDPLRDEGAAYAARLREHGVEAQFVCCEGLLHGFLTTHPYSARSIEIIDTSAAALHRAFAE